MGLLFGLANQIALALLALSLIGMILSGYRMWWLRRPTRKASHISSSYVVHALISGRGDLCWSLSCVVGEEAAGEFQGSTSGAGRIQPVAFRFQTYGVEAREDRVEAEDLAEQHAGAMRDVSGDR